MKKSLFCLMMALIMILTAIPVSMGAADLDSAETGVTLAVNVTVNSDKTVTATWNTYPNAVLYGVWFMGYDPERTSSSTGHYYQVSSTKMLPSPTLSYTFPTSYTLDYAFGHDRYRIDMFAFNSSGNVIAKAESRIFETKIPILAAPKVTLTEDGIVSWTSVENANEYNIHLYTASGSYVSRAISSDLSYDFSDKVSKGIRYYATVQAGNETEGYRWSEPAKSEVITAVDPKKYIGDVKWDGFKLSWKPYPNATLYGLWLYKYSGGIFDYRESGFGITDTSYDFTDLITKYGVGTYRVRIQARIGEDQIVSLDTNSPNVTYTAPNYNVSGNVTSFLNNSDTVAVLVRSTYSTERSNRYPIGNSIEFDSGDFPPGEYSISFQKNNHVTRKYEFKIDYEPITISAVINPIGDITGDGDVTTLDYARANAHAKGAKLLTGYAFTCADVVGGDGEISTLDAARINAHAKGARLLW